MVIVERCFRKKGFSREVYSRIARANRKSSLAVYESKWTVFCAWCHGSKTSLFEATAPLISEFSSRKFQGGQCFFDSDGLSDRDGDHPQAEVGGAFCAGPRVFRPLVQFGDHETKKPYSLSKWDLSLVLYVLLGVPFEPMQNSSV